jgi:hypothetical protein
MQECHLDHRRRGRSSFWRRIGPTKVRRRRTLRRHQRRQRRRNPDPQGRPEARLRRRDGCSG